MTTAQRSSDPFAAVLPAGRGSASHDPQLLRARDAIAAGNTAGAVEALAHAGARTPALLAKLAGRLAAEALEHESTTVRAALSGLAGANGGWHRGDPLRALGDVNADDIAAELGPRLQRAFSHARKPLSAEHVQGLAAKLARRALLDAAERGLRADAYGHAWLLGRYERAAELEFGPGGEHTVARMRAFSAAIDARLLADAVRQHEKAPTGEELRRRFQASLTGRAWEYRRSGRC